MASVLFAGQSLGLVVLPLMLFHQLQLMVCAALARRYAAGPIPSQTPDQERRWQGDNAVTTGYRGRCLTGQSPEGRIRLTVGDNREKFTAEAQSTPRSRDC